MLSIEYMLAPRKDPRSKRTGFSCLYAAAADAARLPSENIFFCRLQQPIRLAFVCRLRIDPHDRLRARRAEQDPAAVAEQELLPVGPVDRLHLHSGEGVRVLGEALLQRGGESRIEAGVRAPGVKRADTPEELRKEGRKRLAGRGDTLGEEKPRENAVLLRHVARHREAGGLFAADRDRVLEQEVADVLEADRRDEDGSPVRLRHGVEPMRGRDRACDAAAVARLAAPEQKVGEKHETEVRVDVPAVGVEDSEPVRVPVRREAEMALAGDDHLLERAEVLLVALRREASEVRVAMTVDELDAYARVPEKD